MKLTLDRCLFLDCESGGLDPLTHPLLEVALVTAGGERVVTFVAERDLDRADPEALEANRLDLEEVAKHGLGPRCVAKLLVDLLEHKREQLAEAHAALGREGAPPRPVVVGHNVGFDTAFLRRLFRHAFEEATAIRFEQLKPSTEVHPELARALAAEAEAFAAEHFTLPKEFDYRTVDTFSLLAGAAVAGRVPWAAVGSLDHALDHFGIQVPEHRRHTAFGDAWGTRLVLERLLDLDACQLAGMGQLRRSLAFTELPVDRAAFADEAGAPEVPAWLRPGRPDQVTPPARTSISDPEGVA